MPISKWYTKVASSQVISFLIFILDKEQVITARHNRLSSLMLFLFSQAIVVWSVRCGCMENCKCLNCRCPRYPGSQAQNTTFVRHSTISKLPYLVHINLGHLFVFRKMTVYSISPIIIFHASKSNTKYQYNADQISREICAMDWPL